MRIGRHGELNDLDGADIDNLALERMPIPAHIRAAAEGWEDV
jgi:hypothetical protein